MHRIPRSRGLFVTTSTYTPRATTIGITCIDGVGLKRLEETAFSSLLVKLFILSMCASGSYALYYYCTFLLRHIYFHTVVSNTESKKIKEWRENVDTRSKEITEHSKESMKEATAAVITAASEVVSTVTTTTTEVVEIAKESIEEMVQIDKAMKEMNLEENQEHQEEEEEWEAPSLWKCVYTVIWGILGYSV